MPSLQLVEYSVSGGTSRVFCVWWHQSSILCLGAPVEYSVSGGRMPSRRLFSLLATTTEVLQMWTMTCLSITRSAQATLLHPPHRHRHHPPPHSPQQPPPTRSPPSTTTSSTPPPPHSLAATLTNSHHQQHSPPSTTASSSIGTGDTYFSGKMLARMAQLALIADLVGETSAAKTLVARLAVIHTRQSLVICMCTCLMRGCDRG